MEERLENIKDGISEEINSRYITILFLTFVLSIIFYNFRKRLKKEIKEMNAAFKKEMADMEALEKTEKELDDVYLSDEEDLVLNVYAEKNGNACDDIYDFEEDEVEITVEDITR